MLRLLSIVELCDQSDECLASLWKSFCLLFPQGVLVALWVYMIYAMVQYARSHRHEEGWEIIVMVEFVIALGVTPYFGIAAQALDDAESMT